MSTRSAIGIMHGDKYKAIYCHSDGYLEYVGRVLLNHYAQSSKVNQLIAMGDLSMLGKEIGEKIDFNAPMSYTAYTVDRVATQCRFYGRDRNEKNVDFSVFHNDQELFAGVDAEYFYVMKDEVWYVSKGAEWSALRDAMSVDNQM